MGGSEWGAAGAGDATAPTADGGRVLIIESDAQARETLAQCLATHGYRVAEAGDGEDGLYRAHEAEVPYDIVLLADHLPDAAGLEMLPTLRAVSPGSLIVFKSHFRGLRLCRPTLAGRAREPPLPMS